MKPQLVTQDPREVSRKLKLLINGQPTRAAVLLFFRDTVSACPQFLIRMAKFNGTNKNKPLDIRMIEGNGFVLIREAEEFLMKHLIIKSIFIDNKLNRKDIPNYSPRTVQEAIISAIVHRDYSIQGGSNNLLIYSIRLKITSQGTLPLGITVSDLFYKHELQPRNKRVAYVMYNRGFDESVGTGTDEMIQARR